jgi:hypothetical protein
MAPSWTSPDCQRAVYDLQIDWVNDDSLTSDPGRISRPLFVLREQKESMGPRDTARKAYPPGTPETSSTGHAKSALRAPPKQQKSTNSGPALAACNFVPLS